MLPGRPDVLIRSPPYHANDGFGLTLIRDLPSHGLAIPQFIAVVGEGPPEPGDTTPFRLYLLSERIEGLDLAEAVRRQVPDLPIQDHFVRLAQYYGDRFSRGEPFLWDKYKLDQAVFGDGAAGRQIYLTDLKPRWTKPRRRRRYRQGEQEVPYEFHAANAGHMLAHAVTGVEYEWHRSLPAAREAVAELLDRLEATGQADTLRLARMALARKGRRQGAR